MTDEQIDPIDNMPPQLREANRRKRVKNGNPASQAMTPTNVDVAAEAPPPWFTAWLASQEQGRSSQFVESAPPPKANARVADPEGFSDFTRKLLEQTKPTPSDYGGDREGKYNIPLRWYLKPDGSYVELQGDSKSRIYYIEKGYRCLDRDEEQRYLKDERPNILREMRHKAALIGGIRKLITRESSLSGYDGDNEWDVSLDLMSIERLLDEWRDLCSQTSKPDRKPPSPPRYKDDVVERDPMLAGVETTPPPSRVREFEGQGRTVEVTPKNANQFR